MSSSANDQLPLQLDALAVGGVANPQHDPRLSGMPAKILLQIIKDPGLTTGDLAAFAATDKRHYSIATKILYEKHINEEDGVAVHWAVLNERRFTLERLVEHGLAINVFGASTALVRHTERFPWIIELLGVIIDPYHSRPLTQYDCRLLIHEAQFFDFAPLALAARLGHTRVATWLLDRGAPIDDMAVRLCKCEGEMYPDSKGNRIYLQYCHAMEASTPEGWTALHFAIEQGHMDMVQLLMARGADPLYMYSGVLCTALHCAAVHEKGHIMKYLVNEGGLDINARGPDNMPVAHMAYSMGVMEMVKCALQLGADVNMGYTFSNEKWTLFAMAIANNDIPFALVLLKLGFDPKFDNLPLVCPFKPYHAAGILRLHRQGSQNLQGYPQVNDGRWIQALEAMTDGNDVHPWSVPFNHGNRDDVI